MQSASTRTIRAGHLIALLVVILLPLHARADIFATFGPTAFCIGGSTESGFAGASDVLVVDLELLLGGLTPIKLVKPIDGCTTALLGAAFDGAVIGPVAIVATEPGRRGVQRVLYEISLVEAAITSVQQEAEDSQLVEGVTIESSAAIIRFFRYDIRGVLIGEDTFETP